MSVEFGEGGFEIPDVDEPPLEVPEVADVPDIPEIDEIPETPEVPEVPEAPETPLMPDIPETPQAPEISAAPEEIEGTPETDVITGMAAPDDVQIQEAVESLGNIENLNPGAWDNIGPDERLETLQTIENEMATIQGRPPVEVVMDDTLGDNTFGGYNGERIVVNANHLNSEMPVDEFIDTIVHEGRHAYQDHAIAHPGYVNNSELVNSWAENQSNYLTADEYGQELYATQPLEADAWDYATQIRNTLIANNWS